MNTSERCRINLALFALLSALVLTVSASAAPASDSCGDEKTQFKVKTEKKTGALSAPGEGQAMVVFVEDKLGKFLTNPTVRYAVDGQWVGANRGPSYFAVSLTPGMHKFCAVRQSGVSGDREIMEKAGILDAGKTYFYLFTVIRTEIGGPQLLASGGVPGELPNMTMKEKPTIDSASYEIMPETAGPAKIQALPMSSFSSK